MGNIKKFDSFVNELRGTTYVDAGNKLKSKGHSKRGDELINYGKKTDDYKQGLINYTFGSINLKDLVPRSGKV